MGSTKTEKESNTLSGSVISVVWQSSVKKIIGNVTVKNYLEESLSTVLCSLFKEKVLQELDDEFLVFTHAMK